MMYVSELVHICLTSIELAPGRRSKAASWEELAELVLVEHQAELEDQNGQKTIIGVISFSFSFRPQKIVTCEKIVYLCDVTVTQVHSPAMSQQRIVKADKTRFTIVGSSTILLLFAVLLFYYCWHNSAASDLPAVESDSSPGSATILCPILPILCPALCHRI